MSKKKRFLYILCTAFLLFVISYACFTGCELSGASENSGEEVVAELPAGGDSP